MSTCLLVHKRSQLISILHKAYYITRWYFTSLMMDTQFRDSSPCWQMSKAMLHNLSVFWAFIVRQCVLAYTLCLWAVSRSTKDGSSLLNTSLWCSLHKTCELFQTTVGFQKSYRNVHHFGKLNCTDSEIQRQIAFSSAAIHKITHPKNQYARFIFTKWKLFLKKEKKNGEILKRLTNV